MVNTKEVKLGGVYRLPYGTCILVKKDTHICQLLNASDGLGVQTEWADDLLKLPCYGVLTSSISELCEKAQQMVGKGLLK